MKKTKFIKRRGLRLLLILFAAWLLCNSAEASLTVTLDNIRDQNNNVIANSSLLTSLRNNGNQIETYHSQPVNPTLTTNRIRIAPDAAAYNSDPGVGPAPGYVLDYSKYLGYVTSDDKMFFVRGASGSAPGGTVWVRVWSGTPNTAGSYYSTASNYSNGALSPDSGTLTATTSYKAAEPYTPSISQFEEATTRLVGGTIPTSTLKVTSTAGSGPDGLREITGYAWVMWRHDDFEPDPKVPLAGKTSQILELGAGEVTSGVTYDFKVRHANVWGNSGWSDPQSYQVAGPDGAAATTEAWLLRKPGSKTGVNTIAIPFNTNKEIKRKSDGTKVDISTVNLLIEEINAQSGGVGTVKVFGWYDANTQMHKGLTYIAYEGASVNAGASIATTGEAASELLTRPIVQNRPYQISVSVDNVGVSLEGFKQ